MISPQSSISCAAGIPPAAPLFSPIVVWTMLLLVSVNLVRIYGGTITGKQGSEGFADPMNVGLALATIALTIIFARVFTGTFSALRDARLMRVRRFAMGAGIWIFRHLRRPGDCLPQLLPFGMPKFDFFAALPLIVFSIISMAEATGRPLHPPRSSGVGATLTRSCPRPSAATTSPRSSAVFGTSLIITSVENVGIVRAQRQIPLRHRNGRRNPRPHRPVAPIGRLRNALPGPVVGGTAVIVFSIIGVIGIDLLRLRRSAASHGPMFTLARRFPWGFCDPGPGRLQPVPAMEPDDPRQRTCRRNNPRR